MVVREDGSVKLVRYDRRHLNVWEHQEGVLAASDVAELFATIRKPSFRRALLKRFARDEGADADFFYVGLRSASGEQGRWSARPNGLRERFSCWLRNCWR